MMWMIVAIAACVAVCTAVAMAHKAVRRCDVEVQEVSTPDHSTCWRVLRSASELQDALARAIESEEAIVHLCRARAERYAALEQQARPVRTLRTKRESSAPRAS